MTAKKISKAIHEVLPTGHCRLNMSDGEGTRIFSSRVRKHELQVRVIHGGKTRWWTVASNESVTVGTLSPYEETFTVGGI